MKKAFTILELTIVIAILAIVAVVILPLLNGGMTSASERIVDIYNGQDILVIEENNIIYEGSRTEFDLTPYELVKVEYAGKVILYVKRR